MVHLVNNAIVNGATFTLNALPPAVVSPVSHTLVVASSTNLLGAGEAASLKTDMEGQAVSTTTYTTLSFPIPGQLEWDGKLLGSHESVKLTKDAKGATTSKIPVGTVVWSVVSGQSASTANPSPPPAFFYDPLTVYPGTWTLGSANNTVLVTNE